MAEIPELGSFEYQTVLGTYRPSMTVVDQRVPRLGLGLQATVLFAGVWDTSGMLHAFTRKFAGTMTSGLVAGHSVTAADGHPEIEADEGALRCWRGEARRTYGDVFEWRAGPGGKAADGAGAAGAAPQHDLVVAVSDDRLRWHDGEALELEGGVLGPGIQIYAPDQAEPFSYALQFYAVSGRAFGAKVEGFAILDSGAWPHGLDWKDGRVYNELQLVWSLFANRYADGTAEWGLLSLGIGRFSFIATTDTSGHTTLEADGVTGAVDVDDEWATRAAWIAPAHPPWIFDVAAGGRLTSFSASRWGGYRAQVGVTRRHGDPRALVAGVSFVESFARRAIEHGVAPVSHVLAQRSTC